MRTGLLVRWEGAREDALLSCWSSVSEVASLDPSAKDTRECPLTSPVRSTPTRAPRASVRLVPNRANLQGLMLPRSQADACQHD